MARTERIPTTKGVTPPRDVPRTNAADTHDDAEVREADDGDESCKPLPEPNTRMGRYVILDRIGQGGMGVVYTAYDHELDRKVALKLLRVSQSAGESPTEGRARLVREAKAMAQLSHPNVVTVHDVGTIEGRVFVAMEYVDGKNLRSWLLDGHRGAKEALPIFLQAARGLAAAHEAGLVHRDFKPDNVLVGNDGRVRVTDFGLARPVATTELYVYGSARSSTATAGDCLTEPGRVMGTLGYMAPEQTDGCPTNAPMDQFAFCVALFEALTGRRPFLGRTREELRQAVHDGRIQAWPKKPAVPTWLRKVVERGLDAVPSRRWPSMQALIGQLERRPLRRRWVAAGAGTVAALSAGAWGNMSEADVLDGRCEGAAQHLAGVWDADRRAAVRDAIVATGTSHASGTWTRVQERLDAYASDWVEMRTESCEATARGEQSGQLLDRRMACLDRRLSDMRALVDVLDEADGTMADRAVWAAASLPLLSPCADLDALAAETTRPRDEAQAAAVDKLRAELARAQAYERVNKPLDGIAVATATMDAIDAIDNAPLRAEALHVLGSLQARLGQDAAAEDNLSEAAMMAAANEHEAVAAAAATSMMHLVGGKPGEYKKGLLWGWYAESAVQRMGGGGVLEADMLDGLGQVMAAHGKLDEARNHLERAAQLRRSLLGEAHPSLAATLLGLGDLSRRSGDAEAAREHYRTALAIQEQALGSLHPQVGGILEKLAALETAAGVSGHTSHAGP